MGELEVVVKKVGTCGADSMRTHEPTAGLREPTPSALKSGTMREKTPGDESSTAESNNLELAEHHSVRLKII